MQSCTSSLAALGLLEARQPTAVLRYARQEIGLLALALPRGLSACPELDVGLVDSPARPAAARHISLTRVLMSVRPRESRPAARLQLEPLWGRRGGQCEEGQEKGLRV